MAIGGLFCNNGLWTARHHPYDPSETNNDNDEGLALPYLRDVPGTGRIAWAQQEGSFGRFEGCFDTDPLPTYPGGGTWRDSLHGGDLLMVADIQQNSVSLGAAFRVSAADRIIRQCDATFESGQILLTATLEVLDDGTSGDIFVVLDADSLTGWELAPASATYDHPFGTFRIPGQACGWVYVTADTAGPLVLALVDDNDSNIGGAVTLNEGDFVMLQGSLLYEAEPA